MVNWRRRFGSSHTLYNVAQSALDQPRSCSTERHPPGTGYPQPASGGDPTQARNVGREYLKSLGTDLPDVASLAIIASPQTSPGASRPASYHYDKPLPPPPGSAHAFEPPRSFRPSAYLAPPSPPCLPARPYSDPFIGSAAGVNPSGSPLDRQPVIDLTADSSDDEIGNQASSSKLVTPRSKDRASRAKSKEPRSAPPSPSRGSAARSSPVRLPRSPATKSPGRSGQTVRCAGYTRTGKPCHNVIRDTRLPRFGSSPLYDIDHNASLLGARGLPGGSSGETAEESEIRLYCKTHAKMICESSGFYSREGSGVWVDFDSWIPDEIGLQAKANIRLAMESKFTPGEMPGFLYIYELREMETPTTSYYKVGRTDNVPRRMAQWAGQCPHTPTLRDVFPLPPPALRQSSTSPGQGPHIGSGSLLPGALSAGTHLSSTPSPACKRWEKLVHLELGDLSSSQRPEEWARLREDKCQCGRGHREVFAVPKDSGRDTGVGEGSYQIVVEIVERWERFINHLTRPP